MRKLVDQNMTEKCYLYIRELVRSSMVWFPGFQDFQSTKAMLFTVPVFGLGVMIMGLLGISGICFYNDIGNPNDCITHSHEVLQHIISDRMKSVDFLLSVLPGYRCAPSPVPDGNNETSDESSSSNTDVVVFSSVYEFKKGLSLESQSEVRRFLERSCTGCGTDQEWSPIRGSCLNYPNMASYDTGARVISAKENYKLDALDGNATQLDATFGSRTMNAENKADTVLMETVSPGRSWAFRGSGELDIKLTLPALIIGLTVHHPPRSILIPGYFASAPKNFTFYGLRSQTDKNPITLGEYEYSADGLSAQTFVVQRWVDTPYAFVRLEITSNHGNPVFTTLYRVEVHGIVVGHPWFMMNAKSKCMSKPGRNDRPSNAKRCLS